MTDISAVALQTYQPLSTTANRVVADAFRLVIAPEEEYDESEVAIERLEFASFVVGGLAAAAEAPPAGGVRSSSRIDIPLADSGGGSASAGLRVTLYGPGDVRGIDGAQIVRRYPASGAQTAEETVLAHVEFNRPEVPWAFSAAPADGRAPAVAHLDRGRAGARRVGARDGAAPGAAGSARRAAAAHPGPPVGPRAGHALHQRGVARGADVTRVRAGEPVAPALTARAPPGHRLHRGGGAEHRRRRARWARAHRRHARSGVDVGVRGSRPAPGLRQLGVPDRPRRRLRHDRTAAPGGRRAVPRRSSLHRRLGARHAPAVAARRSARREAGAALRAVLPQPAADAGGRRRRDSRVAGRHGRRAAAPSSTAPRSWRGPSSAPTTSPTCRSSARASTRSCTAAAPSSPAATGSPS